MTTGKVKWFNNAKGYGFVLAECADEDLFVHYSSIEMSGYRTLRAGQEVSFDIQQGPKGLHAVNVRPLDAPEEEPSADEREGLAPGMEPSGGEREGFAPSVKEPPPDEGPDTEDGHGDF